MADIISAALARIAPSGTTAMADRAISPSVGESDFAIRSSLRMERV